MVNGSKMNIIGVDPGKAGAIVCLSPAGVVIKRMVMPTIGKLLDLHVISNIFLGRDPDSHVFIEDVHAMFGASAAATFSFGFAACAVQMAVVCHDFSYTLVQPKVWQKVIYQGIPELRRPSVRIKEGKRAGQMMKGRVDTKQMSLVAAKRLFPGIDLRRNERCHVFHDGIVDALLIAEYGRRLLFKGEKE